MKYRWRDDKQANAEPRPYLPRLESEVDEAIQKFNVHLPTDPYWWDVVDKMYELEQYHVANIAQRHASPTLSDAITASRRPQIRTLLEETSVGFSTENVISAFERMITSSIREFPILSSVTQFDIADTRICSLDLMDVAPQGDETADRQTSIMYMLARYALVRSWWMGKEALEKIPEKYRPYHALRLQEIGESPKRLCYDEFHRTSKSFSVRAQIIRDVREGRKRGVQIVLTSQLLEDFSKDMVDLATGVWVLGTAISDKAVDDVQQCFGLSETARAVIRHKLTGPKSIGAPCLFVLGSTDGRYEQHLYNTLGPIELWALSTSAEDVAIRNRLYEKLGAGRARRMLAAHYPGGSARTEIRRRVLAKSESGEMRSAMVSAVIEEIVEELIEASKEASKEDISKRVTNLS
jgi:intracellular multiplication protein IcmB